MNLICKAFGHSWYDIPGYLETRRCKRCDRIEIYAHMSWKTGWKWIKA